MHAPSIRLLECDNEETSHEYLLWYKAAATDRGSSSRRYVWGNFSPCWVTQESVCTYYEYEYSSRWPIWHQKISQMSITVWPEAIWIKVKSWWQILMQHQSTYPRGPESASIEILPFRPHFINFSKTVSYEVNLASQCSHLKVLLWSKFWSERGNFNWCRFWAS